LQLIDPEQVKKGEGLDNVLEDLTEGEEVTLTGRLVKTEAKLGRSLMVDFNFWDPKNSFRQVDHRTIKWIILRNKKYTYKKEGLKKKKSVETLGKTSESTSVDIDDKDLEKKTLKLDNKALWIGSKLQKGNWFSSSMYVRVDKIIGEKIDVYNSRGHNLSLTRNILEMEMYSADHYANEEKSNMTDLAKTLEEARDCIFSVVFNKKLSKEQIKNELGKYTKTDMNKESVLKELVKTLQGESVTIIGRLVDSEPKLGRSLVVDLNAGVKNNLRQVDHRTIKHIIFQNTRYSLK
jgi:hypothetical protein